MPRQIYSKVETMTNKKKKEKRNSPWNNLTDSDHKSSDRLRARRLDKSGKISREIIVTIWKMNGTVHNHYPISVQSIEETASANI